MELKGFKFINVLNKKKAKKKPTFRIDKHRNKTSMWKVMKTCAALKQESA